MQNLYLLCGVEILSNICNPSQCSWRASCYSIPEALHNDKFHYNTPLGGWFYLVLSLPLF